MGDRIDEMVWSCAVDRCGCIFWEGEMVCEIVGKNLVEREEIGVK